MNQSAYGYVCSAGELDVKPLLDACFGNRQLVSECLRVFVAHASSQRQVIHAAIDRDDARGLAAACHSLGGSASIIGARSLAQLAKRMEQTSDGGLATAASESAALFDELERCEQLIHQMMDELS